MPNESMIPDIQPRVATVCARLRPYLDAHRANPTSSVKSIATSDVDGEFYWRAANTGFVERIARLRAMPEIGDQRDFMALSSALDDLWIDFRIPHHAGWAHLVHDAPLAVREATIRSSTPATSPVLDERLVVGVRSAGWDGERVAEAVAHHVGYDERRGARRLAPPPRQNDTHEVRIAFDAVLEEPDPFSGDSPLPTRYETIKITIWLLPELPPPLLIGQAYDSIVRERLGWHRHMVDAPAAEDAQRPETAARTWVIGLLMRAGLTFAKAEAWAVDHADLPHVLAPGFRRERSRLLNRVPEAAPYLAPRATSPRP